MQPMVFLCRQTVLLIFVGGTSFSMPSDYPQWDFRAEIPGGWSVKIVSATRGYG